MDILNCCPYCKNNNFIKYGLYRGLQRYQCKNCLKTFTEGTGLLWHRSKKSTSDWTNYCNLMFNGATLRECARSLNICLETSFNWRHKILRHLSEYSNLRRPYNLIALKHISLMENFKGQKKPAISIPRSNRRRVFVAATISDSNHSLARISFKGPLIMSKNYDNIFNILNPKKNSILIPAQDRYSRILAKSFNIKNKKSDVIIPKEKQMELLLTCSYFVLNINRWFSRLKSVATKYLPFYLNWYIYIFEKSFQNHTVLSNIIHSIFYTRLIFKI